jgi:hypothetical protein
VTANVLAGRLPRRGLKPVGTLREMHPHGLTENARPAAARKPPNMIDPLE